MKDAQIIASPETFHHKFVLVEKRNERKRKWIIRSIGSSWS
jgi:hypothetical protein